MTFAGTLAARSIWNEHRLLAIILVLAFALRVVAGLVLPDQGLSDATSYREMAREFWESFRFTNSTYMPLYPIVLGLGGGPKGQLVIDSLLSTATVWLLYALSFELFRDRRISLLAAGAAAIYPFFIFYAAVGLSESLFITLVLASFLAWYRNAFAMAAVFSVLAILTRPSLELLAPLLLVYFALAIHRLSLPQTARHLAVYAVIYVALMSPWWMHNYAAYGSFVRLNLNSGMMLYAGNNPMNRSGGGIDGVDYRNDRFNSIADPVQRDRAFRDAAVAFMKENPRRVIELAWLKFNRLWRPWPYAEQYSNIRYILLSAASFGPILVLSILYLLLWGWAERRKILPILMFAGYLTAVHMVFVSSIRYRLPIEPFLIVLASAATIRIAGRLRVA
jgi:4-amino-4-deoxy-L-arabinose transferase-like glycosyltransferase